MDTIELKSNLSLVPVLISRGVADLSECSDLNQFDTDMHHIPKKTLVMSFIIVFK